MLISELINYCQTMMNKHGDHEIAKTITGTGDQSKPVRIELELIKSAWLKKKTVTEDEEVTIKKRKSLYKLTVDEDIR